MKSCCKLYVSFSYFSNWTDQHPIKISFSYITLPCTKTKCTQNKSMQKIIFLICEIHGMNCPFGTVKRISIEKAMGCPHTLVTRAHLDVTTAVQPEWKCRFCWSQLPKAAEKKRKSHSGQWIQSPACGLTPAQAPPLCAAVLVLLLGACAYVEHSFLFISKWETGLKKCPQSQENISLNVCSFPNFGLLWVSGARKITSPNFGY